MYALIAHRNHRWYHHHGVSILVVDCLVEQWAMSTDDCDRLWCCCDYQQWCRWWSESSSYRVFAGRCRICHSIIDCPLNDTSRFADNLSSTIVHFRGHESAGQKYYQRSKRTRTSRNVSVPSTVELNKVAIPPAAVHYSFSTRSIRNWSRRCSSTMAWQPKRIWPKFAFLSIKALLVMWRPPVRWSM